MSIDDDNNNSINLTSNYSGRCENTPFSNEDILKITSQMGDTIYGPTLFALKYRVVPCTLRRNINSGINHDDVFTVNMSGQFYPSGRGRQWSSSRKQGGIYHATSIINYLVTEYKVDPNTFLYDWKYDTSEKHSIMTQLYIDLGNYLTIHFTGGMANSSLVDNPNNLEPDQEENIFHCFGSIQIFHVPQNVERARTLLQQLTRFSLFPVTIATLQMVCHDERSGFYTSSIRMKKPLITDLKLHYGDDFPNIHEELLEQLQEKDSTGITFLHGPPGTGKTYYLRFLINEIKDKSLIYVPPDLVNDMTKPGFLPFLMQHPNSILIVEDAENIIHDRKDSNYLPNQAVANLLNLSDGLLGDAMHQQIICTFNCDVKGIDSALLRDGRLVIEHKFDKLSPENARRLCIELGIPGNGQDIHESTSLAEIYARKNAMEEHLTNGDENNQTKAKTKRTFKKRTQQTDNLFGFYA